jgi:peptide/nickel transport system ATP-binding protein
MTAQPLLDVNDLTVEFATRRGIVKAVQHVNISVAKGETLGIVGESGSPPTLSCGFSTVPARSPRGR